jgi:hypothetical protein
MIIKTYHGCFYKLKWAVRTLKKIKKTLKRQLGYLQNIPQNPKNTFNSKINE